MNSSLVNPENMMLSERSQPQKITFDNVLFIWKIQSREIHTDSAPMVAYGQEGGRTGEVPTRGDGPPSGGDGVNHDGGCASLQIYQKHGLIPFTAARCIVCK